MKVNLRVSRPVVFSIAAVLAAVLPWQSAGAVPVPVSWSGNGGPSDFDTGFINFAPFVASELSIISGPGFMHSHSALTTVNGELQLELDGLWTIIETFSTNSTFNLSTLSSITFPEGNVSGIFLTASPAQGVSFHSLGGTIFTFNTAASMPEPGSAMLLLLAGAGLLRRRRVTRH